MVSSWVVALPMAAAGLWCWPQGRRRVGGQPGRGAVGGRGVVGGRGAVGGQGVARIGIWAAPALLVLVTPLDRWAALASAVMLLGTLAYLFRRGRRARRARVDTMLLARAVGMIVREVEAGASPSAAGRAAAAELPSSMAALVLGAVDEGPLVVPTVGSGPAVRGDRAVGHSSGVEGARGNATVTVAVERLRTAVAAANRHGIALTGVLTAAAQDLRDRADAAERRVSATAGAVVSGYVLAALPIGGLGLGVAMGAEPWSVLTGSALGGALLVTGAALLCAGLLWADRLVRGRDD